MSGFRRKLKNLLKPGHSRAHLSQISHVPSESASNLPQVTFIDGRASCVPSCTDVTSESQDKGLWGEALAAGALALGACERIKKDPITVDKTEIKALDRLISLLDAQVDELRDIQPFTGMTRSAALSTLKEIYRKIHATLQSPVTSYKSLVEILLNGPDYLIDVAILENIVWQAEVIDPGLGADARIVLDEAIRGHTEDPDTFRRAGENFIALSSAVPRNILDDHDAQEAYKAIGSLIMHLQARLGDAPRPPSRLPSTLVSPAISPLETPSISRAVTPEHQEGFTKFSDASSLEAAFGTGPIPTSTLPSRQTSSVAATPRPSSPTDTETSQEIWKYRGNLLTRSALSLVLRQEALAKADSSGQYAGEVSWDDVRQSYVPKWAEKMRPEDVVEGEVPSTNPAEYRIKRKDAWGNEIGWREGVMFYKNEPSFDSPAD